MDSNWFLVRPLKVQFLDQDPTEPHAILGQIVQKFDYHTRNSNIEHALTIFDISTSRQRQQDLNFRPRPDQATAGPV